MYKGCSVVRHVSPKDQERINYWIVDVYKNIHVNIITRLRLSAYIFFAAQTIWGFQVKLESIRIPWYFMQDYCASFFPPNVNTAL